MRSFSQTEDNLGNIIQDIKTCDAENVLDLFHVANFDLSEDLKNFDWSGISFDGCDLTGCDFSGAVLDGCSFIGAKLYKTIFDPEVYLTDLLEGALFTEEEETVAKDPYYYSELFMSTRSRNQLVKMLNANQFQMNCEHVNHLIGQSLNWSEAITSFNYFNEIEEISPNSNTFDILGHFAETAKKREQPKLLIEKTLRLAKHWGVQPSVRLYSRSISTAENFAEARRYVQEMKNDGIRIEQSVYENLIAMAPATKIAHEMFSDMKLYGAFSPREETYRAFIKSARDIKTALKHFWKIDHSGFPFRVETYNALLSKMNTPSSEQDKGPLNMAKDFIAHMEQLGLSPDSVTYEQLIRLSPKFSVVFYYLKEMQKKRIRPSHDAIVFSAMKADNLKAASILKRYFSNTQALPQMFFEEIYKNLSPNIGAKKLLQWAYTCENRNQRPKDGAFSTAIMIYYDSERYSDALRVASAFPFLDQSKRLFKNEKNRSISYLKGRFNRDEERHHAANSLGYLYSIHENYKTAIEWFEIALKDEGTTNSRILKIEESIVELEKKSNWA